MDFKELAHEVGECGCTFSPAVYNGKRRKENYIGQQLIGLDFDTGVTFTEIKERAEKYRLPILFAYKTFSYTEEYEKFRVVFALTDVITDSFTSEAATAMLIKFSGNVMKLVRTAPECFLAVRGCLHLLMNLLKFREGIPLLHLLHI